MKTEKEKMLSGELYDAADPELLERWHLAKDLTRTYNNHNTRDRAFMEDILHQLLGKRGKGTWIAPPFHVDYGENIYLDDCVEINMNCVFLDCGKITIGAHTGIGPGVHIYAVGHPTKAEDRMNPNSTFWVGITAPVTIGKNVWIGGGTLIMPGVTIGDHTTIAAGSVVTKDIPAHVLAAGNPCRVIKEFK